MSTKSSSPYRVKTTETVFSIIEALNEQDGLTVTDLSREIGMSIGTAHNHLKTLVDMGYVVEDGGQYQVSLKFLHHGMAALRRQQLRDVSQDAIEQLATETEEIVWVVTEFQGKTIALDKALGNRAVQTDGIIGQPAHMHCTANGKAILAELPEARIEEIIDQHGLPKRTENTITTREDLFDELAQTRERGFAINDEESVLDARSIAVSITDESTIYGAISITGPTHRMSDRRIEGALSENLLGTGNEITLRLKYATS